jgi:LPXTG-site transpeptidase (sortase) family protein
MFTQTHIVREREGIPWQRIVLVFLIALALIGVLFAFFFTQRVAAQPLNGQAWSVNSGKPAAAVSQQLTDTVNLAVSKTHAGDFIPGPNGGIYTITVSNVGTLTVTDSFTVTDILPPGSVLTPRALGGTDWACSSPGQTSTCVFTNTTGLPPSESTPPLILKVDVSSPAPSVVTNTVALDYPDDTDPDDDIAEDPTNIAAPVQQGADLAVLKQVTPLSPAEGSTITYTLVITNNGPLPAGSVILTDTLPTGLTFNSAIASQGSYTNTRGTWSVGSLNAQAAATLQLVASVNVGTTGTITNTTEGVRSDQPDGNSANNTGTAAFTVPTTRLVGVVAVQDSGMALPAATVRMVDSANRVFTTTTDTTGNYTFTASTAAPIRPGNATVTAQKRGYRIGTATANLIAGQTNRQNIFLQTSADLVVSKTDGRTTVAPGDTITYTLTITNTGFLTASGVIITDTLPSGMTYVTDTLNLTHTVPSTGVLVWRLPSSRDLAPTPNGVLTFRVRATVSSTAANNTQLRNTVRASTTTVEGITTDNVFEDVNTVSTSGGAVLVVTKTVSPSSASPGNSFTFQIRVTNNGSAAATSVTVTDLLSTYLDVTAQSSTVGTVTSSGRTVTANIGTLNAGASVTINITARVNSTATTTVNQTNTATASYVTGGSTQSRSGQVTFQVIGSSTLPGTGWGPPAPALKLAVKDPPRPGTVFSLVFLVLGLAALGGALFLKALRRERALLAGIGIWLLLLAAVFSPLAAGWLRPAAADLPPTNTALAEALAPAASVDEPLEIIWPTPEVIETLPDYPIPTPQVTPSPNGETPDTSAIQRILIPAVGLDAVVKYVPYDGYTWKIAGLRQEVAWMGETSWPGLEGNTALAGHVTVQGGGNGPFRYLEELVAGDEITLFTEKNIYKYKVQEQKVVGQTDMTVVQPHEKRQLTLITCTGWDGEIGFYLDRLVVVADLADVEPRNGIIRGN